MQSKLSPYLNFRDHTRDAMEFYRSVFGVPNAPCPLGSQHRPTTDRMGSKIRMRGSSQEQEVGSQSCVRLRCSLVAAEERCVC
jgi:predicted 3-demethylubiquinone-9 3-methyltransferase (glyoxalase superfamily)